MQWSPGSLRTAFLRFCEGVASAGDANLVGDPGEVLIAGMLLVGLGA